MLDTENIKKVNDQEVSEEEFKELKEDEVKGKIRLKEIGKNSFKLLKKLLG